MESAQEIVVNKRTVDMYDEEVRAFWVVNWIGYSGNYSNWYHYQYLAWFTLFAMKLEKRIYQIYRFEAINVSIYNNLDIL